MNTPPLHLYPLPSRILLIYLITLHLTGCSCIILTDLPWLLKGSMLLLCASSFTHQLHKPKIVFLSHSATKNSLPPLPEKPPLRCRWGLAERQKKDEWQLTDEYGNLSTATLCGDSIASQHLIILNFKLKQGGKHSLTLAPDALAPQDHRRLRARLLTQNPARSAEQVQ